MTRVGYLDAAYETQTNGLVKDYVAEPFCAFHKVGDYNGHTLTSWLVKEIFLSFMRSFEPYMQESFQLCCDEGASADHSHKFSKKNFGMNGQPIFTASYTFLSLAGMISSLRLVFTKSNSEIEPVLEGLK